MKWLLGIRLKLPVFLLLLSVVAYGILLPKMGFYWDDWPWVWLQHVDGKAGMLAIDRDFRPLSGVTLWLFSLIAGERPLTWQIINLLLRWMSSITCYLALTEVFPRHKEKGVWIATLFLLYPGYTHQFVAVNSSRHLLPFSWFFLSLWMMMCHTRRVGSSRINAILAVTLQVLGMLTSEYYYGLEIARPFFLWFALEGLPDNRERLRRTVIHYLPYGAAFSAIVIWRYAITSLPGYSNYSIAWFEEGVLTVPSTLMVALQEWLRQIFVGLVLGWGRSFELPQPDTFGLMKTVFYGLLICLTVCLVGFLLIKWEQENPAQRTNGMIFLGLVTLMFGGLPFLLAGLKMDVTFPASRLTLPMALGSSLLLIGLIDWLPLRRSAKILLVAILSGLAVGSHFQNAAAFQRDWTYQKAFLEQFHWRVPHLKPGTFILSNIVAETHSSDNSLTAALNWLYFDRPEGSELPLLFFYIETRQEAYFPQPLAGIGVERQYGRFTFRGNTNQAVVVFFEPPACFRLIDPELDRLNPIVSKDVRQVAHLSNLDRVEATSVTHEKGFPIPLQQSDESWCYFYQRAELARQLGRWDEVIVWGQKGFRSDDSPNRADERMPFIAGYAMSGNWVKALELTREVRKINPTLSAVLCQLWKQIEQKSAPDADQQQVLHAIRQELSCGD